MASKTPKTPTVKTVLKWKTDAKTGTTNCTNVPGYIIRRQGKEYALYLDGVGIGNAGTLKAQKEYAEGHLAAAEAAEAAKIAEENAALVAAHAIERANQPTPEPTPVKKGKGKRKVVPANTLEPTNPVEAFHNAEPAAIEANAAEVQADKVEAAKPGSGYRLKLRSYDGLKPMFQTAAATKINGSEPKKITAPAVLAWMERLCDDYEARGLWWTNEAISGWVMAMVNAMGGKWSLSEQDLFRKVVREVQANRAEPEEWTSAFRTKMAIEKAITELRTGRKPTEDGTEAAPAVQEVKVEGKTVKVETTEGKKGGKRYSVALFGELKVTAIIRWMGANGWNKTEATGALATLGLSEVSQNTVNTQIYAGRKGEAGGHGPVPKLTAEQVTALNSLKPAATSAA